MFMHGSWDHILGNMLFLAIFGKNVEDAFGHVRYLVFYIAGGFVACASQTAVTLLAGSASAAMVPGAGAQRDRRRAGRRFVLVSELSRADAGPSLSGSVPAWVFLGLWFLYELAEANYGLTSAHANGGGVAFFAHVGGFLFGLVVAGGVKQARSGVPQRRALEPDFA